MELKEFVQRWQKARINALEKTQIREPVCGTATEEVSSQSFYETASEEKYSFSEEERLLEEMSLERQDEALSAVFLNSRKLAQSFSRHENIFFELPDFASLANQSEIPCFQGNWKSHNGALVLERSQCSFASRAKEFACTYWREALDGIVMGLGEEERSARHGCARIDGGQCVDILFVEGKSLTGKSKHFGEIPSQMVTNLGEIKDQFLTNMKTEIEFVGYSAGTLYFHFPKGLTCGSGSIFYTALLGKIKSKYPEIKLQDISPRAVLGVET